MSRASSSAFWLVLSTGANGLPARKKRSARVLTAAGQSTLRNHGLQGLPRVDGRHDPYATPDDVEFKQVEIPQRFYATGGTPRESWRTIFYANLIKDFADESNGRITSGGGSTCRWVVMGETGR